MLMSVANMKVPLIVSCDSIKKYWQSEYMETGSMAYHLPIKIEEVYNRKAETRRSVSLNFELLQSYGKSIFSFFKDRHSVISTAPRYQ